MKDTDNLRVITIREDDFPLIYSGQETVHMRKQGTNYRGRLGISLNRSKKVYAIVELSYVKNDIYSSDDINNLKNANINDTRLQYSIDKGWHTGWVLTGLKKLNHPISFEPKRASGFWFILTDDESKRVLSFV